MSLNPEKRRGGDRTAQLPRVLAQPEVGPEERRYRNLGTSHAAMCHCPSTGILASHSDGKRPTPVFAIGPDSNINGSSRFGLASTAIQIASGKLVRKLGATPRAVSAGKQ